MSKIRLSLAALCPALLPLALLLGFNRLADAQTPAFPGALGFGANITGGRGGTVYHVTTLADSGPGSFRDAVSSSGRIIVFDVGGYIQLLTAVSCKGNLTIAGQTAPGGGIGFRGGEISFSSRSNVICRYIRIRPGSETASSTDDAIGIADGRTMIFDHVSTEFGPWNNVDAVSSDWQTKPVTEITFQNCLNADPTGQQFGAHTECPNGTMSWFNTIFANSHNRNPLSKINDIFVNNVLYNCGAGYTTHTSTSFNHDLVNNYFISGPGDGGSGDFPFFQLDNNQSLYLAGNLLDNNKDGALNGGSFSPYWYQGSPYGTLLSSPWSALTPALTNLSATTALRLCVSQAGTLPRDPVDDLVISQVKTLGNGTVGFTAGTAGPNSGFYTSQTQTGLPNNGYGAINGGVAPTDTDGDGMPDYWENANGLNAGGNDAMVIAPDGYANIEHYLNWLADPHATTISNNPVEVDLWQHTTGWTNVSPVYTAFAASNGVVAITNGHFARFTPTPGFVGLASYKFGVTGSDGTGWTNTVTVLAQANAAPAGRNLVWRGDGVANLWNTNALNFIDETGTPTAFGLGDNVIFDDTGSNTPAISLPASVAPGKLFFVAAQDYTLTGSGIIGVASLSKVGPGKLTLLNPNAFSGGTILNEGVIQLGDGTSVNGSLSGSITNNDTLIFANPNALTTSASITGSGTVTKLGAGALTLSGTQTYTNLTTVAAGSLAFTTTIPPGNITNNGAVSFSMGGGTVYSNIVSGTGTLAVTTTSGYSYLTGSNTFSGGFTNTSGNCVLSNNTAAGTGPVTYVAGSVLIGGTCVLSNDFIVSGTATTDLMLQGTNGTGTWAGNILIPGSAQWRPGADTGGAFTFTGNANIPTRFCVFPRGSITVAGNANINAGTSFLGRDSGGNKRSANITFRDNATAYLGLSQIGGGQVGAGVTVTIQNNASVSCLSVTNFDLHNVNNTAAISSIRLNGGVFSVGYFTKTKSSQTNIIGFNGGILRAGTNSAAFLPAFNVSTNYVQAGGAKIDSDTNTITIAASLLHDPTLATADGGLTKLGSGTLTLSGSNSFTGNLTVSNGTLILNSANAAAAYSNLTVVAGVLDASIGGITLGTARTLSGAGTILGGVTLNAGATLAPGNSGAGTLTFNSNLTLNSSVTNTFELGPVGASDKVVVSGACNVNGLLNVTALTGFGAGTYTLVSAPAVTGTMVLNSAPLGYSYVVTNTGAALQLVVTSTNTVPPTPPVFTGPGAANSGSLVLSGTNGTPLANFYVLTATNITLPASNWTRLLTNQFDASGNFNFTGAVGTNVLNNYYRIEVPQP